MSPAPKNRILRLVADGKVEFDVRPEVFIDHHPDAEAYCRLYILKNGDVACRRDGHPGIGFCLLLGYVLPVVSGLIRLANASFEKLSIRISVFPACWP